MFAKARAHACVKEWGERARGGPAHFHSQLFAVLYLHAHPTPAMQGVLHHVTADASSNAAHEKGTQKPPKAKRLAGFYKPALASHSKCPEGTTSTFPEQKHINYV